MTISDVELESLAEDLESDRVERKAVLSNKDRIGQAICAFANDLPGHGRAGVLLIGVRDDGRPTGTSITDELLLELADFRDQGQILPTPVMTVQRRLVRGAEVAVVEVQPSHTPPVRFKGQVWIRVGPRRALAGPGDERLLSERRRHLDVPFDSRPVSGASEADIDETVFLREYLPRAVDPDVLAQNGRTVREQLASLRFASPDGVPTAAGMIVLGIEPVAWIPGAYVQFLRIVGHELSDPIQDEKRLDGPLVDVLRQLDELLRLNVRLAVDVTSDDRERRTADYPLQALQQLVRNAVMHRDYETSNTPVRLTWYSDRVEIVSPGGPYGLVTPENFGKPGITDYRNPGLAEAMRVLGYVQRFGVGIASARRALAANGNPPPEFDVTSGYVYVTLRATP